ncbi:glycosyltransferase family 2 protein [Patescibacteria group bacterium]|nr:glycosyltransferase family 2 protein [Patescibacteria group bacterium]MBU4482294.1 glycosyltransferase family 2 protein [Patescibacteria group bacterium]
MKFKKMNYPKYSIILPARNGGEYLPTCVETIISQNFSDYELIISDNHSTDNTSNYLNNCSHPNINVIKPPRPLSMVDHFEFALSHAQGTWQMFLGVDDGVQPYFFELAEVLTKYADTAKIRTIFGVRAYFFWNGCQPIYGNAAVRYGAINYIKHKNCKLEASKVLLGLKKSYFDLPQMYVTAIFKKELLEEVKKRQGEKIFTSLTPDANLAAICCSLEKKYIESGIPLGWVGSSPSSNGFSFSLSQKNDNITNNINQDFLNLNKKSAISYNKLAGNIKFGSTVLYFWEALLQTQNLRKKYLNIFLMSRLFKTIMFSVVFLYAKSLVGIDRNKHLIEFKKIISTNKCNYDLIRYLSLLIPIAHKIFWLISRVFRRITRLFYESFYYSVDWNSDKCINMILASKKVQEMIKDTDLIKKIKL